MAIICIVLLLSANAGLPLRAQVPFGPGTPQAPLAPERLVPAPNNLPQDPQMYEEAIHRFEEYIASKRPGIKNDDNLPFLLTHNHKTGKVVLMVHGLTDSPYYMRALADIFHDEGYNVVGILLPGHGTRPEDLLHVQLEEWQREVEFGLSIAQGLGDEISMAGFSTGGALILDALAKNYAGRMHLNISEETPIPAVSQDNPRALGGLFLFSPALQLADRRAQWACQIPWLVTLFKPWLQSDPGSIRENDPYRYKKMSVNAVCQLYDLTAQDSRNRDAILSSIGEHHIAVFTVQSEADRLIRVDTIKKFMKDLPGGAGRDFILYPKELNIAHADATRPELNRFYKELKLKLEAFLSQPANFAKGESLSIPPQLSQSEAFNRLELILQTGRPLDLAPALPH